MTSNTAAQLTSRDLLSIFVSKDPGCERVGLELEKFAMDAQGQPVPVFGERSIQTILEALERDYGWKAERDLDFIIALRRDDVIVSVEPGGQLELSTPPGCSLDQAFAFEQTHLKELAQITRGWGITWCGAGVHPNAKLEDVGWIPKRRYLIMRDYLAQHGDLSHWMMKMTASLQVSVDYRDEADAARKLAAAARLVPILTAICAASPIVQGRPSGFKSFRSHIWTRTDPARCGLPDCFFKPNFAFADYVDYALDVPLFFIERAGVLLRTDGVTFREFMKRGFDGHSANLEDWSRHLTFLFPEVRLKGYIEIRCCDRLPDCMSFAVATLIKALLYSPKSLQETGVWLGGISAAAARAGMAEAAQAGYQGRLNGKPLGEWAAEAVRLGRTGLTLLAAAGRSSDRESAWLAMLEKQILEDRKTLADHMLAAWANNEPLEKTIRLNCDDPVRS